MVRFTRLLCAGCLLCFLSNPLAAHDPSQSEAGPQVDPLKALGTTVQDIIESENIPGFGMALILDGEIVMQRTFGMADIEAEQPADDQTLWRIGSTSKVFVAMSVLTLQERGLLQLGDPLREHAPEIPFENAWEDEAPIRIVHLLEQSTGFDDMHPNEALINDGDISLFEILTFNPRSRRSRWKPGTFASYSNVNASVAAYVVEKVSGQAYESFVRDQLFEPLQMRTATFFPPTEDEAVLATGYRYVEDDLEPVEYWHIPFRPAGSVNASIQDLTHLLQLFVNRGEFGGQRILQRQSIERMERVMTTLASQHGLESGYGLNLMIRPMMGYTWYGHTGVMDGHQAGFFYLPDQKVGLVATMNEKNPQAYGKVVNAMLRHLISTFPEREPRIVLPSNKQELEPLTGTYRPATSRHRIEHAVRRLGITTLVAEDGHLESKSLLGQTLTLTPAGDNLFYVNKRTTPTVVHFDQGGKHYYQTEGFDVAVRVPQWQAWGELLLAVTGVTLFVSTLVYSLSIPVLRLAGYLGQAKHWWTRLFPVAALLCLFVGQVLRGTVDGDVLAREFTWVGLAEYLLNWSFFILSCCGLIAAFVAWKRKAAIHPVVTAYLFCACSANVGLMLYIFYWVTWLPNWLY